MRISRADVVLVDYPFSDRTGSKIRPCLVVQSDEYNRKFDDTTLVLITSKIRNMQNSPTELFIAMNSYDGKSLGILTDSIIQCHNFLTIDQDFILRRIGSIPSHLLPLLDQCLKSALALQ